MGTSGAYGGSAGARNVRDRTRDWIGSGGAAGGGAGGGEAPSPAPSIPSPPPEPPTADRPPPPRPTVPPALGKVISSLSALLANGGVGGGGSGGAGGGGDSFGGSGGRRGAARAARVGGRALGGAYGARTGGAAAVAELGLDLGELRGLSRYEQAKRILDAALGPKGDVMDSELRKTNAEVVLWALNEETAPTAVDLANRWVVEYVWQTWITESGPLLQGLGANRARVEEEMRAALEATVTARALPDDRALMAADFTEAITSALESLRRISGTAA